MAMAIRQVSRWGRERHNSSHRLSQKKDSLHGGRGEKGRKKKKKGRAFPILMGLVGKKDQEDLRYLLSPPGRKRRKLLSLVSGWRGGKREKLFTNSCGWKTSQGEGNGGQFAAAQAGARAGEKKGSFRYTSHRLNYRFLSKERENIKPKASKQLKGREGGRIFSKRTNAFSCGKDERGDLTGSSLSSRGKKEEKRSAGPTSRQKDLDKGEKKREHGSDLSLRKSAQENDGSDFFREGRKGEILSCDLSTISSARRENVNLRLANVMRAKFDGRKKEQGFDRFLAFWRGRKKERIPPRLHQDRQQEKSKGKSVDRSWMAFRVGAERNHFLLLWHPRTQKREPCAKRE